MPHLPQTSQTGGGGLSNTMHQAATKAMPNKS